MDYPGLGDDECDGQIMGNMMANCLICNMWYFKGKHHDPSHDQAMDLWVASFQTKPDIDLRITV